MTRFLLFLLLLAGGLSGCLDHRIPSITPGLPVTRLRVKKLTYESANNRTYVYLFGYDGQGRLYTLNSYQTPDSSMDGMLRGIYFYDDQNRLTGFRRTGKSGQTESYGYYYNTEGQLRQISHSGGLTWFYAYTETNQLATAKLSFVHPRFTIRGGIKFGFTGNNLTQTTGGTTMRFLGMPEDTSGEFPGPVTTYTHDDKLNPFYGVFVIPSPIPYFTNVLISPGSPGAVFGGFDDNHTLSQNNVVTETLPGSKTTYQYQYNAANLPTVRIKTRTDTQPYEGVSVETLRFEYESY
ncbi:hypothetical protein [Spirosoma rigui]|uniref:hypothetical protein n=1 Tax=Spirosoma rigui TaxID=564064 RepID=UPI0009B01689|nr:hypothetical protein [Spirosoma rigui]